MYTRSLPPIIRKLLKSLKGFYVRQSPDQIRSLVTLVYLLSIINSFQYPVGSSHQSKLRVITPGL